MQINPQRYLNLKVEATRKDQPFKDQVEAVRAILNEARQGTKYKALSYMAVQTPLLKRNYNTADKVYRLISSCSDALNPAKSLNYLVLSKR